MSNLSVVERKSALVVDSRLVSEGLGIQHKNFLETLEKYRVELEEAFGQVAFETETVTNSVGAANQAKFAYLTEDQITFIATLSRNTPQVVHFKIALVKAFSEAKRRLESKAPTGTRNTPTRSHSHRPLIKNRFEQDQRLNQYTAKQLLKLLHSIKPLPCAPYGRHWYTDSHQVAAYLEIPLKQVHNAIVRHRIEYQLDGLKNITGPAVKSIRDAVQIAPSVTTITAWTPAAIFRLGMITNSPVADRLRSLLPAPALPAAPATPIPEPQQIAPAPEPVTEIPTVAGAVMPSGDLTQMQPPDPKLRALTVIQQATRTATEIEALPDGSTLKVILTAQLSRAVQLLNFADFTEAIEREKPAIEPDPITVADHAKLLGKHLSPFQIQQAGIQAAQMYRHRHGAKPSQKSATINGKVCYVNLYSAADWDLVESAIAMAVEA